MVIWSYLGNGHILKKLIKNYQASFPSNFFKFLGFKNKNMTSWLTFFFELSNNLLLFSRPIFSGFSAPYSLESAQWIKILNYGLFLTPF